MSNTLMSVYLASCFRFTGAITRTRNVGPGHLHKNLLGYLIKVQNPELPNFMGESLEESVLFLISFAGDSDVQNLRMTIKEGSKITMRMC